MDDGIGDDFEAMASIHEAVRLYQQANSVTENKTRR